MKVELIAYTPDPERVIAAAAKTCYYQRSVEHLMEHLDGETSQNFVEELASYGHESPIEHISFTFAVEGVSRSLLAQLTRHRIASYSVRSQRYVSEKSFGYVTPPQIEKCPEAKKLYDEIMELDREYYDRITQLLTEKNLSGESSDEKKIALAAKKRAQEDARFVLPNACETQLVMTMNARSLRGFFRQRLCMRAQWEIRELASQMLVLVKQACPTVFKNAGPPCVTGRCTEGAMSCGSAELMREKYGI